MVEIISCLVSLDEVGRVSKITGEVGWDRIELHSARSRSGIK